MTTVRANIETFPCRVLPGWGAIVWYSHGIVRRIYHVCFGDSADAALAAAEIWRDRLMRLGDV